jgi:hypothetical protein
MTIEKEIQKLNEYLVELDNIKFTVEDLETNPINSNLKLIVNEFSTQIKTAKMLLNLIIQIIQNHESIQYKHLITVE